MQIPAFRKTYKNQTVLNFPGIEVEDGKLTAICGHNGSGKSTFGKVLAGIIKADAPFSLPSGIRIGYMNQHSFPFQLSVKKNLLQNADPSFSRSEAGEYADSLLEALDLKSDAGKRANKLSGGQIQRMALARILMKKYDLLILDEPTASMDRSAIPLAEKLILDYQKRTNCTIFLITHDSEQAARLGSGTILLEHGAVVEN